VREAGGRKKAACTEDFLFLLTIFQKKKGREWQEATVLNGGMVTRYQLSIRNRDEEGSYTSRTAPVSRTILQGNTLVPGRGMGQPGEKGRGAKNHIVRGENL